MRPAASSVLGFKRIEGQRDAGPSCDKRLHQRLVLAQAQTVRADGHAVDAGRLRPLQKIEHLRIRCRLAARQVHDVELAAVIAAQVLEDLINSSSDM